MKPAVLFFTLFALVLVACSPAVSEAPEQATAPPVSDAADAPTEAPTPTLPSPTATSALTEPVAPNPTSPPPEPTEAAPEPSPAQFPGANVFCEYGFCIEHSDGLYYYDPAVERVQTNTLDAGILLSCCSAQVDSFLVWQHVEEDLWDPQADIARVVGVGLETRAEPAQATVGDLDVTYQLVQDPTATSDTGWPYGVLASWYCGQRSFVFSLMFEADVDAVAQMEKHVGAFQCAEATPDPGSERISRDDMFCEYEFCIGHSPGLYYYDPAASRTQTNALDAGILLSCCAAQVDSFLVWQQVDEDLWNPQADIDRVVGIGLETRAEPVQMTVGDLDVTYQLVQDPTATSDTGWPYGILASWYCGQRSFVFSLMFEADVDAVAQMEKHVGVFQCYE